MKLKQTVDDFCVEEISDIKISQEKDAYKVYLLEKKSIDIIYLLSYLSKKYTVPRSAFGIAGLKDKHASTKQYVTVSSKYDLTVQAEKNFSFVCIGYTNKPLRIGDLLANRFKIIVRDLKTSDLETIQQKAKMLSFVGVPNYFDSQRFGSAVHGQFIAKQLIRGDYEAAVKIYLTTYSKSEHKNVKAEKRKILEAWRNLDKIQIQNNRFNRIIKAYLTTGSWLHAYKQIPYNLRELFVSAYQSYIWNECIKELLRQVLGKDKLCVVKYSVGELLYFKNITPDDSSKLPKTFKLISPVMHCSDTEHTIRDKILAREGLVLEAFDIKQRTDTFFKEYDRSVLLMPHNVVLENSTKDELNNKAYKMTISFELPKGCYATVVTKALFGR